MLRTRGTARLACFRFARIAIFATALFYGRPAFATLLFNPTFDDAGMAAAGLTGGQIANVHAAFDEAAAQLSSAFSDSIHININVTAVAGTGTLGMSSTSLLGFSYNTIRNAFLADAKSADDAIAVGPGGSVAAADPLGASHQWWVSRAQAKALGLIADSAVTADGTFTFGAGFNYSFNPNSVGPGQIDFQGVVLHELTEIMGRIPGLGTTSFSAIPSYLAFDLFRYTASGSRGLTAGSGIQFSFDGGATLLKAYNFPNGNGSDPQDWASGTNDSFNAFTTSGVKNGLSAVDFQVMDVIGYDRVSAVPEPATSLMALAALLAGVNLRRRISILRAR
jgi:hypothetical protein